VARAGGQGLPGRHTGRWFAVDATLNWLGRTAPGRACQTGSRFARTSSPDGCITAGPRQVLCLGVTVIWLVAESSSGESVA
jgi:hypothetical protein